MTKLYAFNIFRNMATKTKCYDFVLSIKHSGVQRKNDSETRGQCPISWQEKNRKGAVSTIVRAVIVEDISKFVFECEGNKYTEASQA